MRRFLLFSISMICVLLTGCNTKEEEPMRDGDLLPFEFEINVTDQNGENVVEKLGDITQIRQLLAVEYHGYTFNLKNYGEGWKVIGPGPTYDIPLYIYPDDASLTPISLRFGPFIPSTDDDTFTIKWQDGTQDVVKFKYIYDKKSDNYQREFLLNGAEMTEWSANMLNPVIRKTIKIEK